MVVRASPYEWILMMSQTAGVMLRADSASQQFPLLIFKVLLYHRVSSMVGKQAFLECLLVHRFVF
jgi:hypothetical protein